MGCFSKFFLFLLNFIVFVIGVAVIVLASLILSHGSEFQVLLTTGTFTVPVVLLILGLIVMLIGFFGCFGALRESPCLLYTYATIVLVLFLAQVGVAIYGFVEQDEILEFVSDSMTEVFNKYGRNDTDLNTALDVVQNQLKCCGVFNYTDWFNGHIEANIPVNTVPIGCCRVNQTGCNLDATRPFVDEEALIYTQGCYTALIAAIEGEALWMGIGAIILGLVQLGCVLIACGIGKRASNTRNVY